MNEKARQEGNCLIYEAVEPIDNAWQARLFPSPSSLLSAATAVISRVGAQRKPSFNDRQAALIGLIVAGENLDLEQARRFVEQGLNAGSASPNARTVQDINLFLRHCRSLGVTSLHEITPEICQAHIEAAYRARNGSVRPPSPKTQSRRRSAIRALFQLLRHVGVSDRDPTMDVVVDPDESPRRSRPLTGQELVDVRLMSELTTVETRLPALVALTECTLIPSEIALVTPRDIDLEKGTVSTLGTAKRTSARTVPLTEWGSDALRRRLRTVDAERDEFVCIPIGRSKHASASVGMGLTGILRRAGLGGDSSVTPRSIIAWRAACEFNESGDIVRVARLTGVRSLDRAAALINLDWQLA